MNVDSNLKAEVLSSLFGGTLQLSTQSTTLSLADCFLKIMSGSQPASYGSLFINEAEYFDPQYDFDFTNLSDLSRCSRGGEDYTRPRGWYRIALKVRGKYPDGDTWLGPNGWRSHSVAGEWPVSYHGTSYAGVTGIIRSSYQAGPRTLYGRGIYSTPDLDEANGYATTFKSVTTSKTYRVIMQNRINPNSREICKRSDYWLISVPEGTSAYDERVKVESSIRPYGILIREV